VRLLGAFVLLLTASAVQAQQILWVRAPAVLAPDAPIAEAVLRECNVGDAMVVNVVSGIRRSSYPGRIRITRDAEKQRELHLTMLDVTGVGPGPWTRKAVTLRAELVEGQTMLAAAVFDREAGSGGFALRSACTTLGNIAVLLGKQIGNWVNSAMAGAPVDTRARPVSDAPAEARATERLRTLKQLHDSGMISDTEYEQKRLEILKDL